MEAHIAIKSGGWVKVGWLELHQPVVSIFFHDHHDVYFYSFASVFLCAHNWSRVRCGCGGVLGFRLF